MDKYSIINAKIVLKDTIVENSSLLVIDGIIMDIGGEAQGEVIDANGMYLAPGFIDMHIHGAGGYGSDLNITQENLAFMVSFLESKGITTFNLATCCSLSMLEKMKTYLEASSYLAEHVAGVYFEGPFINPEKKGGLPIDSISKPNISYLNEILSYKVDGKPIVRVMTVAPELEGADKIIKILNQNKVRVAFGHSMADYKTASNYSGVHITHLYNAQRGLDHKKAGLALYPFVDKEATYELICDGVHVDLDLVDFTLSTIKPNRHCLISDGMSFCGLGAGKGKYLGKDIYSDGKACYYSDNNVLIGSACLISETGKNLVKRNILTIPELFVSASLNPAKVLGVSDRGQIKKGLRADLILLDDELNVQRVFKAKNPGLKMLSECSRCCN